MTSLIIQVTPRKWNDLAIEMYVEAGWQANYSGVAAISLTAAGSLTNAVRADGVAMISLTAVGALRLEAAALTAIAWGINTNTGGHFSYDNFNFNSFFELDGVYYGCNDNGIFALTGELDVDVLPDWLVASPVTDFRDKWGNNGKNLKYVRDAHVMLRTVSEVYAQIVADEESSRPELVAAGREGMGMHTYRIPVPRGLEGSVWQFILYGAGAVVSDVLEATPLVSKRTKG